MCCGYSQQMANFILHLNVALKHGDEDEAKQTERIYFN
ncbi:hypothetical protein JCM19233_1457 [Vibrio astriarenae]|nr:hypothetical protein JCM19233_1457 [Vibrio sp. C7]